MTKRVFVAFKIPESLQKEILEWEKRFRNLPVRWLLGKNLHVTLVPSWYEEDIDGAIKKLKTFEGKFGSFDVEFRKVSYGPDSRRPRLIWAEGRAPQVALNLKSELGKLIGHKSEYREWKMHLTLARFNQGNFSSFPVKKLDEKVDWRDGINYFALMESRLSPDGADYETLEEIVL